MQTTRTSTKIIRIAARAERDRPPRRRSGRLSPGGPPRKRNDSRRAPIQLAPNLARRPSGSDSRADRRATRNTATPTFGALITGEPHGSEAIVAAHLSSQNRTSPGGHQVATVEPTVGRLSLHGDADVRAHVLPLCDAAVAIFQALPIPKTLLRAASSAALDADAGAG